MAQKTADAKLPITRGEIAAVRGRYDLVSMLGIDTSNPDQQVQHFGIEFFEQMEMKDGHYRGRLNARKDAILKDPWDVLPASDDPLDIEIAEFVKWNLANLEGTFKQDLREMLDAVAMGFSVSEIIWADDVLLAGDFAGKRPLKALHHKPPGIWRFLTDKYGTLKEDGFCTAVEGSLTPTPMPREKFVHFIYDSKYENPYGRGLASTCSWYIWFKKNGLKFWLVFLEKFGSPTPKATTPSGSSKEITDRVDELLRTLQNSTGIRLPDGVDIAFLEAVRRGDAGYQLMLDYCDKQISQAVEGETLTSNVGEGGSGSRALGEVHERGKTATDEATRENLEVTVAAQVVNRLVAHNYITERYPKFAFISPRETAEVTPDTLKVLGSMGLPIGENWAYEHYGIPKPSEGERTLIAPAPSPAPGGLPFRETRKFAEGKYPRDVIEMTERMGKQVEALTLAGGLAMAKALMAYRDALLKAVQDGDLIGQGKPDLLTGVAGGVSKQEISRALESGLVTGSLLGRADAYTDLRRRGWRPPKQTFRERIRWIAFKESYRGLDTLLSPDEAYEYFGKRIPIPASVYSEMVSWAKARAFALADVESGTVLKAMQGHLLEAIDNGWTFDRFRFSVLNDPKQQNSAPIREASTGYLETVFRTNLMSAYNEGTWQFYQDPDVADTITAYQYVGILDSRECELCASMDGQEFLADDPVWDTFWPPNHFNCRCKAVGVTKYDDLNLADKVPVIDGKQVEPAEGFGGTARGYKVRGNA
jgi:SPP1 gp7 family putative phage head morphogenesis protein